MSISGSGASGDANASEITTGEATTTIATSPAAEQAVAALVDKLRAGRCVLCAGPRLGGGDDLRALLSALASTLDGVDGEAAKALIAARPLAAANLVRRRLGERFGGEVQTRTTREAVPEAAQLFGALPFRAVVSATLDGVPNGVIERAFTKDGVAPRSYTPRDGDELKADGKQCYVLK